MAGQGLVYESIADELRTEILGGRLTGELPTEQVLKERFGVSHMTVRQAVGLLRDEGLVASSKGRRTRIQPPPPVRRVAGDRFRRAHREAGRAAYVAEAAAGGWEPAVEVLEVGERSVPAAVAMRLELTEGEPALMRRRRYLANGFPMELATSWVPRAFAEPQMYLEDTGPGGIYALLEGAGHQLQRFNEDVRARVATDVEVDQLRLLSRSPVLVVERLAVDAHGHAVELCETVMAADRYVLSYQLPAE